MRAVRALSHHHQAGYRTSVRRAAARSFPETYEGHPCHSLVVQHRKAAALLEQSIRKAKEVSVREGSGSTAALMAWDAVEEISSKIGEYHARLAVCMMEEQGMSVSKANEEVSRREYDL